MDSVADGGKDHAPPAVVVGPSGNGFWPIVLVAQAIYVFGFEQNILAVLIVFDVVLLVVHHKILDALRDGVIADHADFERPQRWMADVGPALHIAISLG